MIDIRQTAAYTRWFGKLRDDQARLRIDIRIKRLALGNPGNFKPLGGGVTELRIDYSPRYRVYYTDTGKEIVILLCGGDKSTQTADIEKAKKLAQEVTNENN